MRPLAFSGVRFRALETNKFVGLFVGLSRSQQLQGQQMPLTDAKIRALKPVEAIKKLSDSGGLQLWVMPSGGRLWNMAYRLDGKQKKLALGP